MSNSKPKSHSEESLDWAAEVIAAREIAELGDVNHYRSHNIMALIRRAVRIRRMTITEVCQACGLEGYETAVENAVFEGHDLAMWQVEKIFAKFNLYCEDPLIKYPKGKCTKGTRSRKLLQKILDHIPDDCFRAAVFIMHGFYQEVRAKRERDMIRRRNFKGL